MDTFEGITILMALVDFLPVVFFFMAALILMKDLYGRLNRGAYTLLASGSIMAFLGGAFKASWKILVALGICDFKALDQVFFPFSGIGFLLVAIALLRTIRRNISALYAVGAVPEFTSNMPFVVLQVLGFGTMQIVLMFISKKMKQKMPLFLMIVSLIFMLGMGYLSARFDDTSKMHWMAQASNLISNLALYLGVAILHRNGLNQAEVNEEDE